MDDIENALDIINKEMLKLIGIVEFLQKEKESESSKCESCKGSGMIKNDSCSECNGKGSL